MQIKVFKDFDKIKTIRNVFLYFFLNFKTKSNCVENDSNQAKLLSENLK